MNAFAQDMPPPGGYKSINYQRIPPKTINIYVKWAAVLGISALGWVGYHINRELISNQAIEMRSAKMAIVPLLQAENDRMVLRQHRKNREEEERIMKNVKGWEVGKYWKHPVFLTVDPNEYLKPSLYEYYIHNDPKHMEYMFQLYKNV